MATPFGQCLWAGHCPRFKAGYMPRAGALQGFSPVRSRAMHRGACSGRRAPAYESIINRTTGPAMTTFDDRENSFEAKFAHDANMQFRAEARRNKLLGHWASGLMGKEGEAASAYAMQVIESDFAEAGDEDVYRKLSGDLGTLSDEKTIRGKMAELAVEARRQLMSEG